MTGTSHTAIFLCSAILNTIITLLSIGAWKVVEPYFRGIFHRVKNRHDKISENDNDKKHSSNGGNFLNNWKRSELKNHTNTTTNVQEAKNQHRLLIHRYLKVYCLASLSDWLQGPYIYHLYDELGFSSSDIAILFVVGYGSSMCLGSFIAGMADNGGRRKFVVIFSIIYSLNCICKHFSSFPILVIGRILGGIASSLLFSVFDAWLIRAHSDAGLDKSYLSASFSLATYCKFFIAILAGLIGDKVAKSSKIKPLMFWNDTSEKGKNSEPSRNPFILKGGCINVFDLAMFCAILSGVLAVLLWEENYGASHDDIETNSKKTNEEVEEENDCEENKPLLVNKSSPDKDHSGVESHSNDSVTSMTNALKTVFQSGNILICGLVTSLFEGSLFIFVFLWTPSLSQLSEQNETNTIDDTSSTDDVKSQLGLIFATFMVSCMTGSSLYTILKDYLRDEVLGIFVMLFAAASLLMAATSTNSTITTINFNIFETCVGVYFPMMGTLKSEFVPEKQRVAIYNIFRIPLNLIVLSTLLTNITTRESFIGCSAMLFFASILLLKLSRRNGNTHDRNEFESSYFDEEPHTESTEVTYDLNESFEIEEKKGPVEKHLTKRHSIFT